MMHCNGFDASDAFCKSGTDNSKNAGNTEGSVGW
jgi:hypothetical protein